ncbi:biliverdin-producing heme oxygenase [Sphingobium estronivorans]|uniref:biliverdin-producing heme oxygenase n=1 Tax=Sphingobium estronivorans TaxID=1577690 RepID=UPI00123AF86B|nr:biliverdin-producing heme oxygenase [Sphingobium estronivorans]
MKTPHAGRARQALRQATIDNHQRVDDLFSCFSLTDRDSYIAFLKAHARALAALEAMTEAQAPRLPLLTQDLVALGESLPPPLATPGCEGDAFRWGVRYTMEGSRLGGAVLARRVAPDLPHAYLSAAHEKGGWIAFQHSLDNAAEQGGEPWIEEAIRGAEAAFDLFAAAAGSEKISVHG